MRRVEHYADEMRGTVTYEVGVNRYLTVSARDIREHGLEEILRSYGIEIPEGRLPVIQHGREIGTLPAMFEPLTIQSRSFFYDARPGDFKRTAEGWEASRTLGPGDLEAVPGFLWGDPERRCKQQANIEEERALVMSALTGKDPA